jgi:hypothetical protein
MDADGKLSKRRELISLKQAQRVPCISNHPCIVSFPLRTFSVFFLGCLWPLTRRRTLQRQIHGLFLRSQSTLILPRSLRLSLIPCRPSPQYSWCTKFCLTTRDDGVYQYRFTRDLQVGAVDAWIKRKGVQMGTDGGFLSLHGAP